MKSEYTKLEPSVLTIASSAMAGQRANHVFLSERHAAVVTKTNATITDLGKTINIVSWGRTAPFPYEMMGCSVLGRGAEPLVRTQFLEHPPSLNFGANHLKKWIRHPQKPPIPFLSPHNPHCRGGFFEGGQRVRAQLEQR